MLVVIKRIISVFVVIVTCWVSPNSYAKPQCQDGNVEVIKKVFRQGYSEGDLDLIDNVFDHEFKFYDSMFPPNIRGLKLKIAKNRQVFEGWRVNINELLCIDDKVIVRWHGSGKHIASWMGEEPTYKKISLNGISIYQLENNKIMVDWMVSENLEFLLQIEAISPLNNILAP
ncbi:MAG: ester cyclase [Motiliproteus sp.]